MKLKKKLVKVLALTMILQTSAPLISQSVYAEELKENSISTQENIVEKSQNELDELKPTVEGTKYESMLNKLEKSSDELETDIQNYSSNGDRANPETIYDLNSIGPRVELLLKSIEAIKFASDELSTKVEKAHSEIGFEIARATVKIANPFESVDNIQKEIDKLDALMNKLLSYPEIGPEDKATIYAKAKLRKAIWNTRFVRDKQILGKKSYTTYNNLNKEITKSVGIQLNPKTKVKDVDNAVDNLQKALNIALNAK
ncbi:CAMP factor family pore-forming toxin [Peptostreptococcus equinus]|uniref:cAMP factor family pore-forming toxin n=1 Tax=Peptostreptococcus equinus TaxID=3003601 RepID=A0ABY7JNK9_9FIRM|nr:CAMP factor family pore-forming toxin [Peptostreptococcus sp. CBA3647]WAW14965.1 CAMP factor family pore-forming toxin [Peptostreptococcus sp. CBA3647]